MSPQPQEDVNFQPLLSLTSSSASMTTSEIATFNNISWLNRWSMRNPKLQLVDQFLTYAWARSWPSFLPIALSNNVQHVSGVDCGRVRALSKHTLEYGLLLAPVPCRCKSIPPHPSCHCRYTRICMLFGKMHLIQASACTLLVAFTSKDLLVCMEGARSQKRWIDIWTKCKDGKGSLFVPIWSASFVIDSGKTASMRSRMTQNNTELRAQRMIEACVCKIKKVRSTQLSCGTSEFGGPVVFDDYAHGNTNKGLLDQLRSLTSALYSQV